MFRDYENKTSREVNFKGHTSMKKSTAIILVLIAVIAFLLYDKATTKPTVIEVEKKQAPVVEVMKKENRECLLSAERFFENKRSQDVDLYSATWNENYNEITGTCYVQIQGNIYDVKTGELITTRQMVK